MKGSKLYFELSPCDGRGGDWRWGDASIDLPAGKLGGEVVPPPSFFLLIISACQRWSPQ